jgi:hypothetical protein
VGPAAVSPSQQLRPLHVAPPRISRVAEELSTGSLASVTDTMHRLKEQLIDRYDDKSRFARASQTMPSLLKSVAKFVTHLDREPLVHDVGIRLPLSVEGVQHGGAVGAVHGAHCRHRCHLPYIATNRMVSDQLFCSKLLRFRNNLVLTSA